MWKTMSGALALAALVVFGFDPGAQGQANLCGLLPQAEVSSVVGSPLKLEANSKIETSKIGTGTMRSQSCNYNPPGGIGSGPVTVDANIFEVSSPSIAAQMFKMQTQLTPAAAGERKPLSGVGDEAQSFHVAGSVYVRKKNVVADIHVSLRDLNADKETAMARELALKMSARIP